MPRGDPVDGIGVVRYVDAVSGQLVPKSYRPGAGQRRGRAQLAEPLRQPTGRQDGGLPEALARRRVERREDLAAIAVEDGESLARRPGLADPAAERVERADATDGEPGADPDPARRGDPDSQPGEGARAEPDRDQVDVAPAAGGRGGPLDLGEQAGRVQGPAPVGEPQLRLLQSLAVAPGAGGGVGGRGIEADYDQGGLVPRP